jgi:hypothetical protein
MLASKARAYLIDAPFRCYTLRWALGLTPKPQMACQGQTPAYYEKELITDIKRFIH